MDEFFGTRTLLTCCLHSFNQFSDAVMKGVILRCKRCAQGLLTPPSPVLPCSPRLSRGFFCWFFCEHTALLFDRKCVSLRACSLDLKRLLCAGWLPISKAVCCKAPGSGPALGRLKSLFKPTEIFCLSKQTLIYLRLCRVI